MLRFAFKNLLLKKSRTFLAILGLTIAITGVISLIGISDGIRHRITESTSKIEGIIVTEKDATLIGKLDASYEEKLWHFSEVKAVVPVVEALATSIDGEKPKGTGVAGAMVSVLGMDPVKKEMLSNKGLDAEYLIKGRSIKGSDKGRVVVLGSKLADDYDKNVGSKIDINGETYRVVGIFETGSDMLDNMVVTTLEQAQKIMGFSSDTVSEFIVETRDPSQASKLAKKINFRYSDLDAKTSSEWAEEFSSMLEQVNVFFMLISSIAVLVGAIGILNTMLMSVIERYKEFGILRALGWTRGDLTKLIIYESFVLGLSGGSLGALLGYLTVYIINVSDFIPFHPIATPSLIFSAFMLSIILSILGGLYPAWRVSKLDPVEAIRFE